ncbi:MAG: PAS domain-containing protein [Alphaproteobacteria bacterium]|nr:MAG: PAS domain-containing protein [Alphaproteobacteria bacterium]
MAARAPACSESDAGDNLEAVLNSLPDAILVIGEEGTPVYANMAAETFFGMSVGQLRRHGLDELVGYDSPLLAAIEQVRRRGSAISEYEVEIDNPRIAPRPVDIQISPVIDDPRRILITIHERSIAQKIDRQLTHRGAARSVMGMAAVLAHEIKNPLSGIRGSAQLLEQGVSEDDKPLTRLICDEADRIRDLVDRMELFSDRRPVERSAVNLHQVLDHVRRLAKSGFAKSVAFVEQYDPSLPPAAASKDQLIQVFLNLVKNAAEAVPPTGGEIILTTAYRHGVRLAIPGTTERMHLPLEVCVMDNGPGVPADLRPHLFDPFVTTKNNGTGLGLALVAKIIGDHGGIVECDSQAGRTIFRVLLPAHEEKEAPT